MKHILGEKTNMAVDQENDIQTQKSKPSIRKTSLLITCGVLLAAAVILSFWSVYTVNNSDKIYKGIVCEGMDMSGLTVAQAAEKLKMLNLPAEYPSGDLKVSMDEQILIFNRENISASYSINDMSALTAERLYELGRNDSFFKKLGYILAGYNSIENYEAQKTLIYDKDYIYNEISNAANDMKRESKSMTYAITDTALIVYNGVAGREFNTNAIIQIITTRIESEDLAELSFTSQQIEPLKIDLDLLYKNLKTEPVSAKIERIDNEHTIVQSSQGVDFDLNEAKVRFNEQSWTVLNIPLRYTDPDITTAQLEDMLFRDVLADFTSNVSSSSSQNRKNNIKLACGFINETILLPGDVFSYNDTVGKRTEDRGFKEAGAYINGQLVESVGGGICQVSSTLYNAVMLANLEIVHRQNHSMTVGYLPIGYDATVNWGTIDFTFKNNTENPVKIQMVLNGNKCNAVITGTKTDDYSVTIEGERLDYKPYTVVYKENAELQPGTERVAQDGYNGYTYQTYRVIKDSSGNIVSRTPEAKSVYRKVDKIIEKGPEVIPATPDPDPVNPDEDYDSDEGSDPLPELSEDLPEETEEDTGEM